MCVHTRVCTGTLVFIYFTFCLSYFGVTPSHPFRRVTRCVIIIRLTGSFIQKIGFLLHIINHSVILFQVCLLLLLLLLLLLPLPLLFFVAGIGRHGKCIELGISQGRERKILVPNFTTGTERVEWRMKFDEYIEDGGFQNKGQSELFFFFFFLPGFVSLHS